MRINRLKYCCFIFYCLVCLLGCKKGHEPEIGTITDFHIEGSEMTENSATITHNGDNRNTYYGVRVQGDLSEAEVMLG